MERRIFALKRWTIPIILFTFLFIGVSLFLSTGEKSITPDKQENKSDLTDEGDAKTEDQFGSSLEAPEQGAHMYIGMTESSIVEKLGDPDRVDPSAYGYDWWIYNSDHKHYLQIGIENGVVVTVYAIGQAVTIDPFKVGQPVEEIHQLVPMESKYSLNVDGNSYQFELSEEETQVVPLLKMGDIWVQLYIDQFTQKLSSIRYMNAETLIKQRPYELVYRGELINPVELAEEEWRKIEEGKEKQILDLTNVIRLRHGLNAVKWDDETAEVAFSHSKEMFVENYFSHESKTAGGLGDRLTNAGILFEVAGENIAAQYTDAPAAVEGWLNSKGHRETLLNGKFTHLGVGVYHRHYTQNFIKEWK